MTAAHAVAVAVIFTWLGMVVAISFLEAPLKFRAPGVSIQIGLGIGRLVFRALNAVEVVMAVILLYITAADPPPPAVVFVVAAVIVTLAAQLLAVRPLLHRRSDVVLAAAAVTPRGGSLRRSRAHYGFVALEIVKVVALVAAGAALLST